VKGVLNIMIKTDISYQKAAEKLKEDLVFIEKQKKELFQLGLTEVQVSKAIEPMISFHEQLKEEVEYYEHIKRGDFEPIFNLNTIGKTLIAVRIYLGISQNDLAEKLNVSAAQVSRDERNEYYGATIEKIQKVMDVLGIVSKTEIIDAKIAG
jgi:DNA-binding XRE family transcriptional regulator